MKAKPERMIEKMTILVTPSMRARIQREIKVGTAYATEGELVRAAIAALLPEVPSDVLDSN